MTAISPPVRHTISTEYEVRVARDPNEFAAIVAIREQVFRDEQGIVDVVVTDSDDRSSVHVYVVIDDVVAAIGRLTPPTRKRPEGQIAWVATLPDFRRRGAAAAVMAALLQVADNHHFPSVLLSAQTHALPFYALFGFAPYGNRFEVRGIEHQYMERNPPR